jgi:hypothetical protein
MEEISQGTSSAKFLVPRGWVRGAMGDAVLSGCLRNRNAALAQLANAAGRVDQAAFGLGTDFPRSAAIVALKISAICIAS